MTPGGAGPVAALGVPGSYSDEAARTFWGRAADVCHRASFGDVFAALAAGDAIAAVVPVENSHTGPIHETLDLLLASPFWVIGELDLPVKHCLLGPRGASLADARRAHSHPQALAQCAEFLRAHQLAPVAEVDTATAAKRVAATGSTAVCAIASRAAARIYDLDVLADDIQTTPGNTTKFFALARTPAPRRARSKTSLAFALDNVPGALYRALGPFAERGVQVTKLESRPRRRGPWEYIFYLDFVGHADDPAAAATLRALASFALSLRVFGSYPRFTVTAAGGRPRVRRPGARGGA